MKEFRTYGKVVKVDVEIHDVCKYKQNSKVTEMIHYKGLVSWEIITDEDAEELDIRMEDAGLEPDPLHEYLVLHFEDDSVATFRNSFVDMFRY